MSSGVLYTINDTNIAVGAIIGGRYCQRIAGGYRQCTTAGERADGVSLQSYTDGQRDAVFQLGGFAEVLSGAALTDGQSVMTDAAGKAVPFVVATGNHRAGYCDQAVAATDLTTTVRHQPDTTPRP